MRFKCIAYTSLASIDLDDQQLLAIQAEARDLNGIDGITGLLLFDGVRFLQWIEGPEDAIDGLVERLRRDGRHSGFEIREEGYAEERIFGDWAMNLVRVESPFLFARDDVLASLPPRFPAELRERVGTMVGQVSAGDAPL